MSCQKMLTSSLLLAVAGCCCCCWTGAQPCVSISSQTLNTNIETMNPFSYRKVTVARIAHTHTHSSRQIPDFSSWHESTLQWIVSEIQSGLKAKANNEINEVYSMRGMLITIHDMRSKDIRTRPNAKCMLWVWKHENGRSGALLKKRERERERKHGC